MAKKTPTKRYRVNKIKVKCRISRVDDNRITKIFFHTSKFVRQIKNTRTPFIKPNLWTAAGFAWNDCHLFVIVLLAGCCRRQMPCKLKRKTSHFISLKCKLKSLCFSSLEFFGISSRCYPHTYTHYCYQNVFALKMLCIQKQSSGTFV